MGVVVWKLPVKQMVVLVRVYKFVDISLSF